MRTCASCGHENPDESHYCAACGAALGEQTDREVRKVVTILFADVIGSTALGEQLDPESLRRVMSLYFDAARAVLERHGATVEKFVGDAVMAVFGVPVLHEDDALRAVHAAAELRSELETLNRQLEAEYGVSLHVRTGVNTGQVVVGTGERLATGDAVNVAARLEQAAESDQILVGEETFRLLRDAVEVEPVRHLDVKGKIEPISAHPLRRVVQDAEAIARQLDRPLVGRQAELGRLLDAFGEAVAERECRLVTIIGAPGIGKSRLVRELRLSLDGQADVVSGRCLPYGQGITFWPLREIFEAAGARDELDAALAAGATEDIFWAVRKYVERHARTRPLVMVFEDIHWAEPTMLDLILHLAEWTRDAPLLILCLTRPELIDERPAWGAEPDRTITIKLAALTDSEAVGLIAGLQQNVELDGSRSDRILQVAGGNPLFVEQIVAAMAEGDHGEGVPLTIQALLAARVEGLSDPERDVLERASVVGVEFEWEALARIDPQAGRPTGSILSTLIRKELIRPHESIEDGFRFLHVLVRDAAYARISIARRATLHEAVAAWLSGRGEDLDEIVGHHLEQAYRCLTQLGRPGERGRLLAEQAASHLSEAGLRAHGRGDTPAARNLLERAEALMPTDDPRRIGLLPMLGRTLRLAGELDRADAALAEAVELAEATGESGASADARVALVDLRLHRPAQTGVGRQDALREVDKAIRVFEELHDDAGLGRALAMAGKLRFWAGKAGAAAHDLERAARHSRDAGDLANEAESLRYAIAVLQHGPLPVKDALARLEEFRPRAELNRRLQLGLIEVSAEMQAMRGDFVVARGLVSRARDIAQESGLETAIDTGTRPTAGRVELLAGVPAAAEHELRTAAENLERIGELGYLSSVVPSLIDALYALGRYDEALSLTDRWHVDLLTIPEDADAQIGWYRVRSKLLARIGQFDEARRLADVAVSIASGTDFLDARGQATADLSEVLQLSGKRAEAREARREAIRLFEAKGNTAAVARLRDVAEDSD